MAHQSALSTSEGLKGPHTVSLKVLRLSRPSLAHSFPLPQPTAPDDLTISPKASLAYPTADTEDPFIISPLLKLPEAFGSAYVGETFSCTLCANNEIPEGDKSRAISGVRIVADMQTPSQPDGVPLQLSPDDQNQDRQPGLESGQSLQKIIAFELKEEGSHTLAVTVSYTETQLAGEGRAAGGRARTFRKLYQFVAQQLISVKTKTSELSGKGGLNKFVLEAQLENLGEANLSLEPVIVHAETPFKSLSLNQPLNATREDPAHLPVLGPGDVLQVMFLLEQQEGAPEAEIPPAAKAAGRRMLVRSLFVQWRSALGGRGSLRIGPLFTRPR
ncbi:uncharacterized protein K452DRAFT_358297 [Aplosporella prunicola CBS 121167]|uniref:DUF974 domain-containing protein n=1 Tax=Aplosporella prunicola CBS 121167 TaxID=1176127 RepID=A0A6A6BGZ7_9PEZI|nr:uncharacterized protein K452DRAFT_358297 [Aplosporella prunicola CBS 121167]KAF2142534.1 hypothetical protein K452DRAFT_358297 [Aplosporella prunicola CBS 121167]